MIICMILATIGVAVFSYLILTADKNLLQALVVCNIETYTETINITQLEMSRLAGQIQKNKAEPDKQKINQGKKLKKKQDEAKKILDNLNQGKISVLDIIPLAGYRLIQVLGWDGTNDYVKKLYQKCNQFKEKREAMNYTYYLLASLFGNVLLGITGFFAGTAVGLAMNMGPRSLVIGVVLLVMFALLGYLPYDSVSQVVQKRQSEIENEFPQVMSKLALLTVAGMEVSQAWKLASVSGEGTLYDEMNRVLTDLDNNVSPTEAYQKFITRCNNTYTTKLATAIIQNLSKGNSEIVTLFRQLNDESWLEHKHNARRMGEKIQSKLLIPTMLMFGGIIILIIVPVMSGFNL